MAKVKYIKSEHKQIIVFPELHTHLEFSSFNPISAGFIGFGTDKNGSLVCECYGRSVSLNLDSDPKEDTKLAMNQLLGYDGMYY